MFLEIHLDDISQMNDFFKYNEQNKTVFLKSLLKGLEDEKHFVSSFLFLANGSYLTFTMARTFFLILFSLNINSD